MVIVEDNVLHGMLPPFLLVVVVAMVVTVVGRTRRTWVPGRLVADFKI